MLKKDAKSIKKDIEISSKMANESKYNLRVTLNALNHLGMNLYSNVPAVISEVVANSYDADAEKVEIIIDTDKQIITIKDDGCGMAKDECNKKYLEVGYKRRENDPVKTPKFKRHVMGRKGIGKLSLFSIARTIDVQTVKIQDGNLEKNGFTMDADKIKHHIESKGGDKCPLDIIDPKDIDIKKGTKVVLRNLKRNLSVTERFLRRRLARRFSIISKKKKFSVIINKKPITLKDREYFKNVQYLWYKGDYGIECKNYCTNSKKTQEIDGTVSEEKGYEISGWIGTFDERKNIEKGNNAIVILAWGKVIHEDILKDLEEGGVYSKYLIGEIQANFLDLDANDDIATTDRQSVKEDDLRFVELKEHIKNKILKEIEGKWGEWRKEKATENALENPKVKEWFNSLKGDNKKYARRLFMKIESFPIEDADYKKSLYKHGILAFETLALNSNLSVLDKIETDNFDEFMSLLKSLDALEASHYYEVVKARIGVLKKFMIITTPSTKERVLQEYIFDHLWLLDESWGRCDPKNKKIEESVVKEFRDIDAKLTEDERKARIDIRYRTAVGKHIIVELKKYDAKVNIFDLVKQLKKYKSALMKCLTTKLPGEDHQVEIVCILGSPPKGATKKEIEELLKALDARYVTYDKLIDNTLKGYDDYLKKEKEINRIQGIIENI